MVNKIISIFLAIVLVLPMQGFTQVLPYMPVPSQLLNKSIKYDLPTLKGIEFDANNPLKFTFVFNRSDLPLTESILKDEAEKIGKYFLAALTIPEDDLWVNLSPYEEDRIMPDKLSQTDLGKDMLGEDYVLKQLAASLTYPDSETGRGYWGEVNKIGPSTPPRSNSALLRVRSTTSSPAASNALARSSFTKVWIVPDKIHIYESPTMVVIDYARLKVLTETDYLAQQKNNIVGARHASPAVTGGACPSPTESFKKYILPSIEKEVNQGQHFAHLRQLYSAIILATWFKDKLKNSILNSTYFGKGKIKGADCNDPKIKEKIYNEYVKAFQQGAYNYVKRETTWSRGHVPEAPNTVRGTVRVPGGRIIRRQYFSGGAKLTGRQVREETTVDKSSDVRLEEKTAGLPTAPVRLEEAESVDQFSRLRLQRAAENIVELALNSGLEFDVKNTLLRNEIGKQLGDLSDQDRAFAADEIARAVMAWVHEGYRMGPIVDRLTPLIELYRVSSFLRIQQEAAKEREALYSRTEARISDPIRRERNLKIIKDVVGLLRDGKRSEAEEMIRPLLTGPDKADFIINTPAIVASIIIFAVRLEVLSGDPVLHAQDIMDMVDAYNRKGTLGSAYGRMVGQLRDTLEMLGEGRTDNKSGFGVIQGGQVSSEALKREWKTMVKFDWFSNRATVRSVPGDMISELKSQERLPEAFIEAVWTAREQSTSEAEKLRDIQQAARDILQLDEESAQVLAQWFIARGHAREDNDDKGGPPSATSGRDAGPGNDLSRRRDRLIVMKAQQNPLEEIIDGHNNPLPAPVQASTLPGRLFAGHDNDNPLPPVVSLTERRRGLTPEPKAKAPRQRRGPVIKDGSAKLIMHELGKQSALRSTHRLSLDQHRKLVETTIGEFRWRAVAQDFMRIFSEKTKRKKSISLAEAQGKIAWVIWGIYNDLNMTGVEENSAKWYLALEEFVPLELEEKLGDVLFGSGELEALMKAGALGWGVKLKNTGDPSAPENTGGLDFAKVKDKKTTVAQGGVKLAGDDALAFLQSPDFAGLVLRVESVKLK